MPLKLNGQVAIVTGAGGGLGRAHALALAARGAAPVEIAHRTGLPLDAVAMLLELSPAR